MEKRWLPIMTNSELFDFYKDLHADHENLSSWSSFCRAWKEWQSIFGMRPPHQHSRCDACAKYSKFRRLSSNQAELHAITAAYNAHIREVFHDRQVLTNLENSVEQAVRQDGMSLPHICITIDGMDKCKWLLPRTLENSKKMGALWRPALHFVGVLVPGVMEYYALLEADQKGDSDTQQTLLARALDLREAELLQRGKDMPRSCVLNFDNTAKEGRNSQVLLFASGLVLKERFDEVTLALYRVGHTHNRLDQRFGVIASKLSRATCLQTPDDYVGWLKEHYKPARNVALHIEVVKGIHLWRDAFKPFDTHFRGMQGTGTTADAAHVLRVLRKDLVGAALPHVPVDLAGPGILAQTPVLLAKHHLCSKALSQEPTVLLYGDVDIDFEGLLKLKAPRHALNAESIQKYERTAHSILEAPWSMDGAAAYLLDWLKRNRAGDLGEPPPLVFVVQGREFMPEALPDPFVTWKDFAQRGSCCGAWQRQAQGQSPCQASGAAAAGIGWNEPPGTGAAWRRASARTWGCESG